MGSAAANALHHMQQPVGSLCGAFSGHSSRHGGSSLVCGNSFFSHALGKHRANAGHKTPFIAAPLTVVGRLLLDCLLLSADRRTWCRPRLQLTELLL
jgi:hypothetical protein